MEIWRLATCGNGLHVRSSIPFDYLKWSKSRSRALSLLGQRWAESCRHRWGQHRRIHDDNTVCSRRKLDGYWVCHAAFYYVILNYRRTFCIVCALATAHWHRQKSARQPNVQTYNSFITTISRSSMKDTRKRRQSIWSTEQLQCLLFEFYSSWIASVLNSYTLCPEKTVHSPFASTLPSADRF